MSMSSQNEGGRGKPFTHDLARMEIDRIQQEIEELKSQMGDGEQRGGFDEDVGLKVLNLQIPGDAGTQALSYDSTDRAQDQYPSLKSYRADVAQPYNPLNKGAVAPPLPKTNTLPYSRDKTVSIHDMKVPHVQSMGVVPIRSTGEIHGLNIMMQGKPVLSKEDSEIDAVQEANEDLSMSPAYTSATSVVDAELRRLIEDPTPQGIDLTKQGHLPLLKKPAILGSEGTIAPVRLTERAAAQPKGVVIKKLKIRTVKSPKKPPDSKEHHGLLRSEDVFGSENGRCISENSVDLSATSVTPGDSSGTKVERKSSSAGSRKSIQELLAEAVDIASPESTSLHKRKRVKGDARKGKKQEEKKGPKTDGKSPQERSVDEIIAKLKASKEGKISKKSEADLRIREIMGRVMNTTGAVLGTDGESLVDQERDGKEVAQRDALSPDSPSHDVDVIDDVPLCPSHNTSEEDIIQDEQLVDDQGEFVSEGASIPHDDTRETFQEAPSLPVASDALPAHSRMVLDAVKMVSSLPQEELERAWRDLKMPQEVGYGDVVRVEGSSQPLIPKQTRSKTARGEMGVIAPVQSASVSFLSTWAPSDKLEREKSQSDLSDSRKSIHHFCTMNPAGLSLPHQLQMTTRMHHTPSRYKETGHLRAPFNNIMERDRDEITTATDSTAQMPYTPDEKGATKDMMLHDWQDKAEQMIETGILPGQQLPIHQDASRLYWTPAPPKMNLPGKVIAGNLFPRFHGAAMASLGDILSTVTDVPSEEEEEVDLDASEDDEEMSGIRTRLAIRRCASASDLAKQTDSVAADSGLDRNKDPECEGTGKSDGNSRRPRSAPDLIGEDHILSLESDYDSCMKELLHQQEQIERLKHEILPAQDEQETPDEQESKAQVITSKEDLHTVTPDVIPTRRDKSPTLAEKSRAAGLKYVLYPEKKRKKKKRLDPRRLENIEAFLKTPARVLERRHSFEEVSLPDDDFKSQINVCQLRRPSLPLELDFDQFVDKHQDSSNDASDEREWVRQVWDDWFEETFAQSRAASDIDGQEEEEESVMSSTSDNRESVVSSAASVDIDVLSPLLENDADIMVHEDLQAEIERLTDRIEGATKPFDIARRGALYRKMGLISQAWEDLNTAIEMEPQLLDAYWHRHLLHLLKGKPMKALEDLNIILKINKGHVGAYKSRAEIFKQQGDVTMAIVNYTQSIKLMPDDYEAYYKRAEMYEKRDEMLLALEDYKAASRLMPSKTEAIFKRGLYQFNTNKNWLAAIKDFTELLQQEPKNAVARTYRGRALAKQGMYQEAMADLSAGIHLDPSNSVAFYHRGCLLRRARPQQALRDLSISILLDDGPENLMAFFHRGILYKEMGRHQDAICDFEGALQLDRTLAAAHVNVGLIYLNKLDSYYRAIQKFTSAIKVDPTYDRALVCRGEAYNRIHKPEKALKDFTSAIHLQPDKQHYYMFRGQVLLKMKNLELASFCVRHAAELSDNLGSSPMQQAAVQSFLQNYSAAMGVLRESIKTQPNAPSYILLGRTQIKAKKFRDAVSSLEKALDIMKPWIDSQSWPPEAAEVYYLIGMCHMEIPNYLEAFEAFNSAIRINSEYPEAYYQRGLTRMKLRQSKGILDFNRALSLSPGLFQAYLSRAAYYGMKKRYSKGIFNCNEAVRLQPDSVRGYLYRGALKFYIQAYHLAIVDLTKAIEVDTSCSLAYFNRAVCYHTTGDFSKAQRDYGIVLMLGEEDSLKVLINRGLLYLSQKDYKNARGDFVQAVQVNPRDPKIRHTLAICCHKLNRLEEAVSVYTDALQVDPFFLEAYLGRASALMDYGHAITVTLARRDCERAIRLDPSCLEAWVGLGYNMQVCGRFKQAWNHFTAALAIDPGYQPALEGRAVVCLQMSDTSAALKDLNSALRLGPTAELHTNRGVVHQFMVASVDAMTDYQCAIKIDPTYALAYFNAANLYFNNRQFLQANEYYNKTITLSPDDEAAVLNRAITRVLLRDVKGALEDFQQAASLSPYSAHIFFNRANLFASLRKYELAERDYSTALQLLPDDALVYKRRADVRSKLGRKDDAISDYRKPLKAHRGTLGHVDRG